MPNAYCMDGETFTYVTLMSTRLLWWPDARGGAQQCTTFNTDCDEHMAYTSCTTIVV
jgi:hypothetical protein